MCPPLRWKLPPRRAVHPKRSRLSFRNEKKLRILLACELRKQDDVGMEGEGTPSGSRLAVTEPCGEGILRSLTSNLYPLISNNISLQGNSSDSLLSRISTWEISNLHVDIFYFPRGRVSFLPKFHFIPPKFHFIPPKNFLFSTWGFRNIHVEIRFPRHSAVSICSQL